MKKTLMFAATITCLTLALIPAGYTSAREDNGKFPHIDSNGQFPPIRWVTNVRHTIQVHIPQNSSAISQLHLEVPYGLTVKDDIQVSTKSGQTIQTNTSINGSKVVVTFLEPVTPGTKLIVELNHVKRTKITVPYSYRLSANIVGSNVAIPIGVAYFRMY
ncbi:MAG: hypothetical protein VKL59_03595 [Nostocaceae cyanobacterium]|nr:hypothetical protein [Nostocaceae cyanobacterium]